MMYILFINSFPIDSKSEVLHGFKQYFSLFLTPTVLFYNLYRYFAAQELLEVGKNNAQTSENDPLVFPPTFLPTSAPKTLPVLLGATPKIQSATHEKGNYKEKVDDSTPKKG